MVGWVSEARNPTRTLMLLGSYLNPTYIASLKKLERRWDLLNLEKIFKVLIYIAIGIDKVPSY